MKRLRELADGCVAVDLEADPVPCFYQLRFTNVSSYTVELRRKSDGGLVALTPLQSGEWVQWRIFGMRDVEDSVAFIAAHVRPTRLPRRADLRPSTAPDPVAP